MKNPEELLQKIKQLESELKKVKSCKRYGLVWEDKPEIFEEKAKNALPILQEDKNLRIENDENKPNNIIIEGDNYHSLSALSYTHKSKIDVIYIDPPYNTGNKDFIYNDRFVDKEDSYRHSKWLSFMSKRLKLAKELLSDDGVIYMSIDDNEAFNLKLLSDEVFNEKNYVGTFVWKKKKKGSHLSKTFRSMSEYVLCYFKNIDDGELIGEKAYSDKQQPIAKRTNSVKELIIPKNTIQTKLSDGIYESGIKGKGTSSLNFKNSFEIKKGIVLDELKVEGPFVWIQKKLDTELKLGTGIFLSTKFGFNVLKSNQSDKVKTPSSLINEENGVGTNEDGRDEVINIFNDESIFTYPKPTSLIKYLVKTRTTRNKTGTILDFFAGSGTTGHAVMELNKEDGGNRQFILCSSKENTKSEPEKNICKNITYERNKRVIEGYTNLKGEKIKGLGGNLRYYTNEFIKADKSIDDLRYSFIDMCDDLLCIKENTFTEVKLKKAVPELRLFKKGDKYTAILYDIHHFKDLIKLLEVLNGKISVYIFSLSKDIFEEELEYLNKNITVQNIPDDILQTYKKIFNF